MTYELLDDFPFWAICTRCGVKMTEGGVIYGVPEYNPDIGYYHCNACIDYYIEHGME